MSILIISFDLAICILKTLIANIFELFEHALHYYSKCVTIMSTKLEILQITMFPR